MSQDQPPTPEPPPAGQGPSPGPPAATPPKPGWFSKLSDSSVKIGAIIAVPAAIIGLMTAAGVGPDKLWNRFFGEADVKVTNTEPRNGPEKTYVKGSSPTRTSDSVPQISLTLVNEGTKAARIDRVKVHVDDYAQFGICYSQGGGGDITETAPVSVPLDGAVHRDATGRADKIINPGDGTHFVIGFGEDEARSPDPSLYAVTVTLETDDKPIRVGKFVLAFPGSIRALMTESFPVSASAHPVVDPSAPAGTVPRFDVGATWCYRHQWDDVQRLLNRQGDRSSDIKALSVEEYAKGWERNADQTPAREAVAKLLTADWERAKHAIYAAQQTKDQAFVDATIDQLARRAEADLDAQPRGAGILAETVNQAAPSVGHQNLVLRARLRQAQAEAEAQAEAGG